SAADRLPSKNAGAAASIDTTRIHGGLPSRPPGRTHPRSECSPVLVIPNAQRVVKVEAPSPPPGVRVPDAEEELPRAPRAMSGSARTPPPGEAQGVPRCHAIRVPQTGEARGERCHSRAVIDTLDCGVAMPRLGCAGLWFEGKHWSPPLPSCGRQR